MLTSAGFLVEVAEDGLTAVAQARAWKPHPDFDGHSHAPSGWLRAATQRIKAAHLQPDPVIIALTASTFDNERARVIAVGCDDFLRKPFSGQPNFPKDSPASAGAVPLQDQSLSTPRPGQWRELPGGNRPSVGPGPQGHALPPGFNPCRKQP